MATFIQRGNKWRVQIRIKGVSRSATFMRHADAKAWATRVETQILDGEQSSASRHLRFDDLLERYAREITPNKRGAETETYTINRFRRDKIAKIPLDDLRAQHFAQWRDERLTHVLPSTVQREIAVLSAVCEIAVKEWGLLRENPVRKISKPPSTKERTRRPSEQETQQLCKALLYTPDCFPQLKIQRVAIAYLFAIETAMRAGEICSLTWDNVDFNRRIAHLPMTKNGHSRDVPLSKRAMILLTQLQGIDKTRVFHLTPKSLSAMFHRAKERCQIEDLHFHDTRREALTRMAKKVPVETLAKISGHRSLTVLLNVYYRPDIAEIAHLLD